MGFLGAGLAGIDVGRTRPVALAVVLADVGAHVGQCLPRHVGGVGAHVGDVAGFVEPLRQRHRLAHAEAQADGCGLLHRGGDERRRWPRAGVAVFAPAHDEVLLPQPFDGARRRFAVAGTELLAAFLHDLEAHRFVFAGLRLRAGTSQLRPCFPVLLGIEGADFALAFDDQPHRHRLHAPGGEPARHLRPQQRRQLEAHHAVEEAPRLLGIDAVLVHRGGVGERLLDGALGDFVEDDALVALRRTAEHFRQMPGNRLAFAVQVGGEVDAVGAGGQGAQVAHHLLLARNDLVVRLPAVLRIHAHALHELRAAALLAVFGALGRRQLARLGRFLGARFGLRLGIAATASHRQIADMAGAGLDGVVASQVAVDGRRLGGRLDDDQRTGHDSSWACVPGRTLAGTMGGAYIRSDSALSTQGASASVPWKSAMACRRVCTSSTNASAEASVACSVPSQTIAFSPASTPTQPPGRPSINAPIRCQ